MASSTAIASDAMRFQLAFDTVGVEEVMKDLYTVKAAMKQVAEAKEAEALRMERLAVEAKFSPESARALAIEKVVELTKRLNLDLATQAKLYEEIADKYRAATPATDFWGNKTKGYDAANDELINNQMAADAQRVAAREKALKETARLEDEALDHYSRYVKAVHDADMLLKSGTVDRKGFQLRLDAAKEEYKTIIDLEAKKAQAKKDAADKQADADAAAINKRAHAADEETKRINSEIAKRNQAVKDAAIDTTQRRAAAAIATQEAADKSANAERQRAISLMNKYSDATEMATNDIAQFNAMLAAGTMTAEEHANAIANVDRRMRSMAGGAGRAGFVVGNVLTGVEDFATVMSMTGFSMDSFAASTRAASNNLGQAVRGIGTAGSAMLAPLVSIGAVLLGFAIPAIYKWITGVEEAAEATKKWKEELDRSIDLFNQLTFDVEQLKVDKLRMSIEIDDETSKDSMDKRITETLFKMTELDIKLRKKTSDLEKTASAMWDSLVPPDSQQQFNEVSNSLANILDPKIATELESKMAAIREDFLHNVVTQGGEKARAELERQMKGLVETIDKYEDKLSVAQRMQFVNETGGITDFTNVFGVNDMLNDAGIIDRIQANKEMMAELSQKDTEEARKLTEELESQNIALDEMLEKRQELLKAEKIWKEGLELGAETANNAEFETDKQMLQLQVEKNKLVGDEKEAERELLKLAERRKEIMESGLLAPDQLEGLFNEELTAIAADIEKKLIKLQDIVVQTDMMSAEQAYTSANRQILEASREQKTEEKEMIQLLTAIKDHLAGGKVISMEIQ